MINLDAKDFPSKRHLSEFAWYPVLLQPVVGSPEQLVVAVLVHGGGEHVVLQANSLEKLECFYTKNDFDILRVVIEESCIELGDSILKHADDWQIHLDLSFSNIVIGQKANCYSENAAQAANMVLAAHSSLHRSQVTKTLMVDLVTSPAASSAETDRLPWQVFDFLAVEAPSLAGNFSRDIAMKRKRRSRRDAHNVHVDYKGLKLAANFGTLGLNGYANSINQLKRQLWDLKVFRDTDRISSVGLSHELFVFHRDLTDPMVSKKEANMIQSALGGLEQQADLEEVRLRPFLDIPAIGRQIKNFELTAN